MMFYQYLYSFRNEKKLKRQSYCINILLGKHMILIINKLSGVIRELVFYEPAYQLDALVYTWRQKRNKVIAIPCFRFWWTYNRIWKCKDIKIINFSSGVLSKLVLFALSRLSNPWVSLLRLVSHWNEQTYIIHR